MKSFDKWKYEEVERTFGVRKSENMPSMEVWMNNKEVVSEEEKIHLGKLQKRLQRYVWAWKEEDLKVFFIIPLIDLVRFEKEGVYRAFMEPTIQAKLIDLENKEWNLRGRVEFLVATGEQDPHLPFFFLNEYKPQLKPTNDPLGQLLIAMLVAQKNNENHQKPVYGLYTLGQLWFFVTFHHNQYAVSKAYDATSEDIFEILKLLKFVKREIEELF
jgi:hypothetical protein